MQMFSGVAPLPLRYSEPELFTAALPGVTPRLPRYRKSVLFLRTGGSALALMATLALGAMSAMGASLTLMATATLAMTSPAAAGPSAPTGLLDTRPLRPDLPPTRPSQRLPPQPLPEPLPLARPRAPAFPYGVARRTPHLHTLGAALGLAMARPRPLAATQPGPFFAPLGPALAPMAAAAWTAPASVLNSSTLPPPVGAAWGSLSGNLL